MKSSGNMNAKKALPILLIMAQILGAEGCSYEGLSLVAGIWLAAAESFYEAEFSMKAVVIGAITILMWNMWAAFCSWWQKPFRVEKTEKSTQTPSMAVQISSDKFVQEYVERAQELQALLHEECQKVRQCEEALIEVRTENRALRARRAELPRRVAFATTRGRVYHLPGCPFLQASNSTRLYDVCNHCDRRPTG